EDLKEREVWFMDVVEGIKRVRIIDDFELMKTKKIFSLHDYDLSYEIKLLKKIGKLKKAFLIAIPYGKKEKEVLKDVENQIHLILKK
ncbi:MAG: hypothetical protein NZ942_02375, partial [Candidatus Aenigmarchaeota archaeon]|nr:hypothetical protein [Candidatus Aenigmarchaeota archaeon]